MPFTMDNTTGYTQAELDTLNAELAERLSVIDQDDVEARQDAEKAFYDEVSRRVGRTAQEFPDYDLSTLPEIPDGFQSTAWHNESCPTWHERDSTSEPKVGDLMLAIDYADESRREMPGGQRFNLHMYDGACEPHPLISSDDWAVIEDAVSFARYVRRLGLGFHPDTRGDDYVNADGSRTFTDEEAADYDDAIEAASLGVDPYAFGIEIWETMGLTPRSEPTKNSEPPQSMGIREAVEAGLKALQATPSGPQRNAAQVTLQALLDQQGCEHIEGRNGLCETCDVVIFG
jgi:hypothetical protein